MYIYIYNMYTYIFIHIFIGMYIGMYLHICIRTYVHRCVHTYMHTYVRTYIHPYKRTCIHTSAHPYIHSGIARKLSYVRIRTLLTTRRTSTNFWTDILTIPATNWGAESTSGALGA